MDHLKRNEQLVSHVFNGASVLLGLCITAISIFHITDKLINTIIDEILVISSLLFTFCIFLSYMAIRNKTHVRYQKIADVLFIIGLASIFIVGLILIVEGNHLL